MAASFIKPVFIVILVGASLLTNVALVKQHHLPDSLAAFVAVHVSDVLEVRGLVPPRVLLG